jgi:molybdate transport system substrate-binding protein
MKIVRGVIPFLAAVSLWAQAPPVHVLASNGMKAVILELEPQAERALGHPLAIEFGSTTGLMEKIDAGTPFDVTILTSDAIAKLAQRGQLAPGTRVELSRCGVGLAVRSGMAKPDIGSSEAMKQTLLKAKSIAYAKDGASRSIIDKMFERLGIAAELKPKLVLTQGSGPAMASVASGQTAMVLTLISELKPVHGIDIVGPLPEGLQGYINFGGAASAKASNAETARALIALLKAPATAGIYKAKGMEAR